MGSRSGPGYSSPLDLESWRNPQSGMSPVDNEQRSDVRLEGQVKISEFLTQSVLENSHACTCRYAAIDPGSTASRAVIVTTAVDEQSGKRKLIDTLRIQETRPDDDQHERFTRGEWPSTCCPFDGPPYHVGYDAAAQDKKRNISIKAIPYFRTQGDDDHPFTKALYDHSKSLPSDAARKHINDILDDIIFRFLNQIVQRILDQCKEAGVKLRLLALCIPQTWSRRETSIQDYLSPIIDKTVAGKDIEITFALEAQCQAQYLIHKYPRQLRGYDELMVLDFGGHSLGGSDSQLHWGSTDDRPRFHAPPGSDFGVRGGYELWEIGIGRCIDRAMNKHPKTYRARRHMIKASLLNSFFNAKAKINFSNPHRLNANLTNTLGNPRASYSVTITAEQLNKEWESAFREAIDLATQNIRLVARTGRKVRVLLTGGSAHNKKLRVEIENYCANLCQQGLDVTCTVVSKDLDTVLAPKWSIAEGAALCHATTMEVEEFFDLGAAFALQTWTTAPDGKSYWPEKSEILFCKEKGVEQHSTIDVEINEAVTKIRIIASPFHMASGDREASSKAVLVEDSYDVWQLVLEYLPASGAQPIPIPKGRHILEVAEMVCHGTEAILVLRMRPNLVSGSRRSKRVLEKLTIGGVRDWSLLFEVPLTSCGPSNLVELDIDLIRGRFWRIEGDDDETSLSEEENEGSVELGSPWSPPAKRRKGHDGWHRGGENPDGDFQLR
ncbi:hypothetical protein Daus18300_009285 [Diaporthe australafricana]|uniref:Uncharacterized protein n=1 Tax=Diaporthe australafricana TaxID=127596 RepID=A0ABR3WEU4_9PEZI